MSNLAYSTIDVPTNLKAQVEDYVAFLIQKEEKEKSSRKKSSDFFGCLDGRLDGMEIQRRMREDE